MSNAYILNENCQEFAAKVTDKWQTEHALALFYTFLFVCLLFKLFRYEEANIVSKE